MLAKSPSAPVRDFTSWRAAKIPSTQTPFRLFRDADKFSNRTCLSYLSRPFITPDIESQSCRIHSRSAPTSTRTLIPFLDSPPTSPIMADLVRLVGIGFDRFTTNLRGSLEGMSPEKWIRIVIVVGTYCLIRPYLLKLGGKQQMKQHEKEAEEANAKMSPNELRGHKVVAEIPEDSDDEAEGQATATDWGKKARRRQRNVLKKILDAEEKRLQDLQDDDEDKDIQEFLTE